VIFGSVEGGNTFGELATQARLRFEVRSESDEVAQQILAKIESIVLEVTSRNGIRVTLDLVAQRHSGGLAFDHPIVSSALAVMEELELQPRVGPSMSELSAFIDRGIPAVTVGLTRAQHMNTLQEEIEIDALFTGITQLLRLLQELDEGDGTDGH
jgi:di/tripeptidase